MSSDNTWTSRAIGRVAVFVSVSPPSESLDWFLRAFPAPPGHTNLQSQNPSLLIGRFYLTAALRSRHALVRSVSQVEDRDRTLAASSVRGENSQSPQAALTSGQSLEGTNTWITLRVILIVAGSCWKPKEVRCSYVCLLFLFVDLYFFSGVRGWSPALHMC